MIIRGESREAEQFSRSETQCDHNVMDVILLVAEPAITFVMSSHLPSARSRRNPINRSPVLATPVIVREGSGIGLGVGWPFLPSHSWSRWWGRCWCTVHISNGIISLFSHSRPARSSHSGSLLRCPASPGSGEVPCPFQPPSWYCWLCRESCVTGSHDQSGPRQVQSKTEQCLVVSGEGPRRPALPLVTVQEDWLYSALGFKLRMSHKSRDTSHAPLYEIFYSITVWDGLTLGITLLFLGAKFVDITERGPVFLGLGWVWRLRCSVQFTWVPEIPLVGWTHTQLALRNSLDPVWSALDQFNWGSPCQLVPGPGEGNLSLGKSSHGSFTAEQPIITGILVLLLLLITHRLYKVFYGPLQPPSMSNILR